MANINPVIQAAKKFQGQIGDITQQITDQTSQGAQLIEDAAKAEETIGVNNSIITSAKLAGELAAQEATQAIKTKLGLDMSSSSEMVSNLTDTIWSNYKAKQEALSRIRAKESVGFFDNPLQWIINQFTVNDDITAHNIADAQQEGAQQQLDKIQGSLRDAAVSQNAAAKTLTASAKDAAAQNVSLLAKANADKTRLEGIRFNVQNLQAVLSADRDYFNTYMSVNAAQQQQEQIAISQGHLAIAQEQLNIAKKKELRADLADKDIIDTVNRGRIALYGNKAELMQYDTAKASNLISLIRSNNPIDPKLLAEWHAGSASTFGKEPMIATSPAQAATAFATAPVQLSTQSEDVKKIILGAVANVDQQIKSGSAQIDSKNKVAVDAAVNKETSRIISVQASNIDPNDRSNVFNIPRIQDLAAQSKVVAESSLYIKLLKPLADVGVDINNPNIAVTQIYTALRNGKITYQDALDYSLITVVGAKVNHEARRFEAMGITNAPVAYNTKIITDPSALFSSEIVDITKPDLWGRAINKYLARSGVGPTNPVRPEDTQNTNPFSSGVIPKIPEFARSTAAGVPSNEERMRLMFPEQYPGKGQ